MAHLTLSRVPVDDVQHSKRTIVECLVSDNGVAPAVFRAFRLQSDRRSIVEPQAIHPHVWCGTHVCDCPFIPHCSTFPHHAVSVAAVLRGKLNDVLMQLGLLNFQNVSWSNPLLLVVGLANVS